MKTKSKPLLGFGDFETDPFKKGREPKAFVSDLFFDDYHLTNWDEDCGELVADYIINHGGKRIWYFHNGGKFDIYQFLEFLPRKRITKILVIGGRIAQIVFDNGVEIRDSYALIPRGLREWAKDDIDYNKLEKECREKHRKEIIHYLKSDTDNLSEMVNSFVDRYGFHLTLASAAFDILHEEFNVKRVRISEAMDAKFRKFYFAGRVEYFKLGNLGGGYKCIDINSSFPYSMTKPHWCGKSYVSSTRIPKRYELQSFYRVQCNSAGAFPFRNIDGSVMFPADNVQREFYVTGWEFFTAEKLGLLSGCRILQVHAPTEVLDYKKYIEYFYGIKNRAEERGDKGERLFAKLLMNSGYGKFGQDPREFEEYKICDWRDSPGDEWRILKDDPQKGITIYKRANPSQHFNNVCVAASITGCSRALLLEAMHICGNVVYCDTDSIIAKDIRGINLSSALGEWKLEAEFTELHIGGKKLYCGLNKDGKWKTASKGAKLSAQEIIRVANGETVQYEFEAPTYSIRNISPDETGKTRWARFTKRKIRRGDKIHGK